MRVAALLLFSLLASRCAFGGELTVLAAASLSEVMKEAAVQYERTTGDRITLSFAGSSTLARQIRHGAPADVFISADERQMDELIRADLIDARSRTPIVSNQLVVVVPADQSQEMESLHSLAEPRYGVIALANPEGVPAGVYAKRLLQKKNIWKGVEKRIVSFENVRGALAAVESGNADAAIVYRTDALASSRTRVAFTVSRSETADILYVGGVLSQTAKPAVAGNFVRFLLTPEATAIFKRHGFLTLH